MVEALNNAYFAYFAYNYIPLFKCVQPIETSGICCFVRLDLRGFSVILQLLASKFTKTANFSFITKDYFKILMQRQWQINLIKSYYIVIWHYSTFTVFRKSQFQSTNQSYYMVYMDPIPWIRRECYNFTIFVISYKWICFSVTNSDRNVSYTSFCTARL